jgi:hypothetical protein
VASEEDERLNRELTIVAIADTIKDRRPAGKGELRLARFSLVTFFAVALGGYYVMPPAQRIIFDAVVLFNSKLMILTLLTYILLLITVVALAYSTFRRMRILGAAEELECRLRSAEGWLEDSRPPSDLDVLDIADAFVLSWNLTMSGDLEIATRLRALLPKGLLQYWPLLLWNVPGAHKYRANNFQSPIEDWVVRGEQFAARANMNGGRGKLVVYS